MLRDPVGRLLLALALFLSPQLVQAGGGPENVVVVVNADSPASLLIANYYVSWRQIPPRNVVYLNNVPNQVRINFAQFREQILLPVLEQIRERKLQRQVDYVVYSADFPTQVTVFDLQKRFLAAAPVDGDDENVRKQLGNIYRPYASINALTYYFAQAAADQPGFFNLESNLYFRGRCAEMLLKPFVGERQTAFEAALQLGQDGDFEAALEQLAPLAERNPMQVACQYWMARFAAQQGDLEESLRRLELAIIAGWSYRTYTAADLALVELQGLPEFQNLLARIPDEDYVLLPTLGFRSRYRWGRNGMINSELDQGDSYLLSTVLAVTRNQGLSEEEALRQLQRSVAADGTEPRGEFVFTESRDVRTRTRRAQFPPALAGLERLGQRPEVVKSVFPQNRKGLLGLSIGTAKFSFEGSRVTLAPGAIAENLTSFGGALEEGKGQTKLTEFLREGAAGSSGTVFEPLSIPNKFPDALIHVHYVRGASLAEAYYQSVAGPYQLLIVGDALCRPWARIPRFALNGVEPGEEISGEMTLTPDYSEAQAELGSIQIYLDGQMIQETDQFGTIRFDTTRIGDGFHEFRVVAISRDAIRTTGRVILPVVVNNLGQGVEATPSSDRVDLGDSLDVSVEAPGAQRIELWQGRRPVARLDEWNGGKGTLQVATEVLGRGPSTVHAVAYYGTRPVLSRPMTVWVEGILSKQPTSAPLQPKPKQ